VSAARLAGGSSVVSSSLRAYLPTSLAMQAPVFSPGVDYTRFTPRPKAEARQALNLDPEKKYILFSAVSNAPIKRLDIALQVEAAVAQLYPGAQLLMLTQEPYWRVPLYLNAADCLLLTSDKEGSPNIVKEALSLNLPVVSVDVGDTRQRCVGLESCWICSQKVPELVQAVCQALCLEKVPDSRQIKREEIDISMICRAERKFYQEVARRSDSAGRLKR
jgi:teichuronic acid biosynthesis glycosyltransferase TuaC